jgi:1,5-anhydro-D-fructose reductase (1,5-anhydro-D-mannitol-forming)
MNKIRYGIIGFGAFAERAIMPAMRKSPNSELVAIQKRSPDMAKWKAQEHGIPLHFSTAEELVASPQVDAVFIVSANSCHHPETLAAAAAKKHVIVEKPMAMDLEEAQEMVDHCRRNGVKFMVGHMLRFSPLLRRMKEIVRSGAIGEITSARSEFIYDASNSQRAWLWDKQIAGGGPLFDIAIHCIDALRFVLDDTVTGTQCVMRTGGGSNAVEKSNIVTMKFSKGTIASVYSSFETPYRQTFIECIGTTGSISAQNFTPSNVTATLEQRMGRDGQIRSVVQEEFLIPDLYELEISHFSDCILNGREPFITNQSSLHNQEILELSLKNCL